VARVVVVGGGFAGLATAIWLADFGHEVVLCERHDTVGGEMRQASHEGDCIDLTPGPLTLPAVLRDLFRKTGRPLERVLDLIPAEPAFRFQFADGSAVELPNASRAGITRSLDDAFGRGNGAAWQEVVDYGGAVWRAVRLPFLAAEPTRLQRFAVTSLPGRRRELGLDRTLRSLTAALPPLLGSMLEHHGAGVDPRRAPAGLAAIAYVHQTFGRWYVQGGTARLVAAVHERAAERGVTVRTNTPVTAIESSGRRVTGVRVQGDEHLAADVVVAAVDVAILYRDLLPNITRKRRPSPRSPGRFTVTLALGRDALPDDDTAGLAADSPAGDPPVHTVLLSPDTDAALDAVHAAPSRPPESPTIDVYSTPDLTRMTATALVPAHGDDVDWMARRAADDYADQIIAMLAERGMDIRDRVRWRHVHTPADTAADTGSHGGAQFGPAITNTRDIAARSNRTPVRGLYHVGRSAYPGPGIPLGGISAAIVADLIGRA
jgi:phytoene desaturase